MFSDLWETPVSFPLRSRALGGSGRAGGVGRRSIHLPSRAARGQRQSCNSQSYQAALKAVNPPLGINAAILVIHSYLRYPFISVRSEGGFDIASFYQVIFNQFRGT